MRPEELKIGNWVHATVPGVPESNLKPHRIASGNDIDWAKWYFAIPLTEEILIKAGFEKNHGRIAPHSHFILVTEEVIFIVEDGKMFITTEDEGVIYVHHVKNLHQLQNLYFEIRGEELNIEL